MENLVYSSAPPAHDCQCVALWHYQGELWSESLLCENGKLYPYVNDHQIDDGNGGLETCPKADTWDMGRTWASPVGEPVTYIWDFR
jgi:hypothetical protein